MTDAAATGARRRRERRGRDAEAAAARFLEREGFQILSQRLRTPAGEIDLIAYDGSVLAFVEVKARTSVGRGMYALSARQAGRIALAAEHFLANHPEYADAMVRLDLIVVTPGSPPTHFPNAWQDEPEL